MIRLGVFVLVGAAAVPSAIQAAGNGPATMSDSAIIGGLIGLAIILAQVLGKAIDRWKPNGGNGGSRHLNKVLDRLESDLDRIAETRSKIIDMLDRVERALLKLHDSVDALTATMAVLQNAHQVTRETMRDTVAHLKEQLNRIERKGAA
jgi:hypothetical protein